MLDGLQEIENGLIDTEKTSFGVCCAERVSVSLYWVTSLLREPMDSEEARLGSSHCFSRSSRSLTMGLEREL